MSEPLTRLLADLPAAELSPAQAERIRRRCRARLVRQAPRGSAARVAEPGGGMLPLWQPLIVVLAIAYLTEVIVQALRVYSLP